MATKKSTRKSPKRVAAGKKAARTRARNRRKPTRRRRRTTKKGMLSELFNPKMAQASFKSTVSGGVGGAAAVGIHKITGDMTPIQKSLICAGASFLASTMMKVPNTGAGIMGGSVALSMQEAGMLNEGGMRSHNYANTQMEKLPMVLNENGEEMYLQANDEMYLQENDDMFLQEDFNIYGHRGGQGFSG